MTPEDVQDFCCDQVASDLMSLTDRMRGDEEADPEETAAIP